MPKLPTGRFPFINLTKALERAQSIFENDKNGKGLKVPVAFSAWGYSDKSSGGFQTIAALKGYGLLEDEGANDDRAVKLTAKARQYFQTEIDADKAGLRSEFAKRPALMAHLLEHWDGGTVDDPVARTYLKTAIGMNEQSARSALGIYKDNLSHIGDKAANKSGVENHEMASSSGEDESKFGGARVGDVIDWEVDGNLCNPEPLRVRALSDDGKWVFVQTSSTGIPMEQVIVKQRHAIPFPPKVVMDQAFGLAPIPPTLPLDPIPKVESGPLDVTFDMKTITVSGRTSSPEELQAFIDDLLDLKPILAKRTGRDAVHG